MKKVPPPPTSKRSKGPVPPRPPTIRNTPLQVPHLEQQTPEFIEEERQQLKTKNVVMAPVTTQDNKEISSIDVPQTEIGNQQNESVVLKEEQVAEKVVEPQSVPAPKRNNAPQRTVPPAIKNKSKAPPKSKIQTPQVLQLQTFKSEITPANPQPLQHISSPSSSQVPILQLQTPPPSNSQMYEKLMQLRKAKEQMEQEVNDQYQQDEEEEYVEQEVLDEVKQVVQQVAKNQNIENTKENEMKDQEQKLDAPDFQSPFPQKEQNFNVPSPLKEEVAKVEIPAKVIPPAPVKNRPVPPRKGVPAPPIKKAPTPQLPKVIESPVIQQPQPEDHSEEKNISIQQPLVEEPKKQVKIQPPVLFSPQKQEEIVNPQPKVETKVKINIPKPQNSVLNDINVLLERYHSLKSTYISNMHSLEQLVSFQKKQEEVQVDKIKNLIEGLSKKNQRIKQLCKLRISSPVQVQGQPEVETI